LFSELTWPILATTFNLFSVSVDSLESRGALDFEALPNDSRPVVMFKALVWMSLLLQARAGGLPLFVDVAQKAGITLMNVDGVAGRKPTLLESVGNGAGFLDYDNDGDEDLLIANGSTWETFKNGGDLMAVLYRNDAGKFTDVTRQAGLDRRGWGMGVCVADYDNDGYRDFYVTAYGSSALYKNNRNGTFREVSETAGVRDTRWSTGCSFGDYDRDGNLDLYVANYLKLDAPDNRTNAPGCQTQYMGLNVFCGPIGLQGEPDALYRNNGDGTFSDVTKAAGIKDPGYYGFAAVFSDLDNDGWPDIYVANDSVPNLLFHNNKNGTFSEMGLLSGTALGGNGKAQAGMGLAVGDYDGNGFQDLFVTNFTQDSNTLYQNIGDMVFNDVSSTSGLAAPSIPYLGWGTAFADLDNDGFEDLLVAYGHIYPGIDSLKAGQRFLQPKQVFRNMGNGRFSEITRALGGDLLRPRSARGTAVGDYDNDGDIDAIAINLNDRPNLYQNVGGNKNHWISLRLEGTKSNRDAIGARVVLRAGGKTQLREIISGGSYLSSNDLRVHFGLGDVTSIESVQVQWPGGKNEEFTNMEADRILYVREGAGIVPRL
jgi:hypothetical protein